MHDAALLQATGRTASKTSSATSTSGDSPAEHHCALLDDCLERHDARLFELSNNSSSSGDVTADVYATLVAFNPDFRVELAQV
jgi:hypothetical protein